MVLFYFSVLDLGEITKNYVQRCASVPQHPPLRGEVSLKGVCCLSPPAAKRVSWQWTGEASRQPGLLQMACVVWESILGVEGIEGGKATSLWVGQAVRGQRRSQGHGEAGRSRIQLFSFGWMADVGLEDLAAARAVSALVGLHPSFPRSPFRNVSTLTRQDVAS